MANTTKPPRGGGGPRPTTLAEWRHNVVGITKTEAVQRTGLTTRALGRLEAVPHQATLGALVNYVGALGGRCHVILSLDGEERQLLF